MLPNMEGLVCTLSAVICTMAFVHQKTGKRISSNAAMFNSHMDRSQQYVVCKRLPQESVRTDQKGKPGASKQTPGKCGTFCLVL